MGRAQQATAIGYAVMKDIRNSPLREVDRAGQRRMWGSSALALLLLALILASAWMRVEQIQLGYRIEQLQRERAVAESERRHLLVELESLRAPQRIEALATRDLKLVSPTAADAFVLERVRATGQPSSAVMARR